MSLEERTIIVRSSCVTSGLEACPGCFGVGVALHDLDLGDLRERGESGTPHLVLKRRLRHHRDFLLEKDPQDVEEDAEGTELECVAFGGRRRPSGEDHSLLDLVAADRRAPDGAGEAVGERCLARTGWPADDHEDGESHGHSIPLHGMGLQH